MRIWLIKMLYRSLSPLEQRKAQKHLKQPSIDAVMADTLSHIDENWERSATYKVKQSTGGQS